MGFADYAVIENNLCMYSQQEHGIYFSNSADHPIIRYNTCHHNNANGIHMNGDESMGGDGLITDATVECNIIYENGIGGGSGINCDGVAESRIFNNLLYMNHASGISLYCIDASAGSYNNKIYNNTIINATDARWCLNINTDSYGDTVYNNILINLHPWRGSISIDVSSLPDFWSDYNVLVNSMSNDGGNSAITLAAWQVLGYDPHSMLADPLDSLFADWSSGDYHLRAGCQATDSGTDQVLPIVQYDLDGVLRPQGLAFDIGVYEHPQTGIIRAGINKVNPSPYRVYQQAQSIIFKNLNMGDGIAIFDLTGRNVHCAENITTGIYRVCTKSFSNGVYFYVITSAQSSVPGKFVVIK